MRNMKLSLWLAVMITVLIMLTSLSGANSQSGKIHFQDSSELGDHDNNDERPGNGHKNNRGRARGHHKQDSVAQFEEGLPGLYPIKGPVQQPLILPSSHPGRGVGLQKQQNNVPVTNNNLPQQKQYENNPFLSKFQTSEVIPTNKYNPNNSQGVTNQLPTSDKPITTTPTYVNPRQTDLLYGSNLLEEDGQREGKSVVTTTDVNFGDRGLFDTAPHCQPGQILVNNRCRTAV